MDYNRLSLITDLPYNVPPIEYVADALPWHPALRWEMREPSAIKRIIVHHMASEAPLVNQAQYHINAHGWHGLSYHLVVSEGRLKQINNLLAFTYHAASNNADTVSIAIHGDLSKRELRQDERELLYAGILTLKRCFAIDSILGHNEVNATACPCTSMNQIREDIAKIEMTMQRNRTKAARLERAFAVANQSQYMYNLAKGNDGNAEWAMNWLDEVHAIMKERGLLK